MLVGADRERVAGGDLVALVRHEVEMHDGAARVRVGALEVPDAVVVACQLHLEDILTGEHRHQGPQGVAFGVDGDDLAAVDDQRGRIRRDR